MHLGTRLYGCDKATESTLGGGYIIQDIRGTYGSEGDYVMNRPLRGSLNPTPVDESTDAYDSIDWLVKNAPECNGRVGVLRISEPVELNTPLTYRFARPTANHVILPGHRLLGQIQPAWFPPCDRNPQTFVPRCSSRRLQEGDRACLSRQPAELT